MSCIAESAQTKFSPKNELLPVIKGGKSKKWKPQTEQTSILRVTKRHGEKCMIAVYPDVRIMTVLSGPDQGIQFILRKTHGSHIKPQDASQKISYKNGHKTMIHRYKWGKVITEKHTQEIQKN